MLPHDTVSREHARICWDPRRRRHAIRDLGSRNGSRVDDEELASGLEKILEDNTLLQLGDVLLVYERDAPASDEDCDRLPGASSRMHAVRAAIARAAEDPSPLLLLGETGTGKEWAAREAHRRSGRSGPFVAVNCAELNPQLIESQLFGHLRGAFTGALNDGEGFFTSAQGGTLFLDEIGELPLELQPKLLRALQEREVLPVGGTTAKPTDCRIIAATNRDLADEIRAGRFRRDLYARIALWEIELPALRTRRADILGWVERLHDVWGLERSSTPPPIELTVPAAARVLLFSWDENLRGVERLIHALGVRDQTGPIEAGELPSWIRDPAAPPAAAHEPRASKRQPSPSKAEFVAIYQAHQGNVSAIARHFGRHRKQVYRWIESFELRA